MVDHRILGRLGDDAGYDETRLVSGEVDLLDPLTDKVLIASAFVFLIPVKDAENQDSRANDKPGLLDEAARQKEKEAKASEKQAIEKENAATESGKRAEQTPDSDPKKAELHREAKELKKEADKLPPPPGS